MNTGLRQQLVDSIAVSVRDVHEKHPGDAIVSYALCTDADLLSVYGAACTASMAGGFKKDFYRYLPAEWSRMEFGRQFAEASSTLDRLASAHYAAEGDDVGPDDDHLRPWKGELLDELVAALREHRDQGTFEPDVFLIATPHDSGQWLWDRVAEVTRSFNTPGHYEEWRRHR